MRKRIDRIRPNPFHSRRAHPFLLICLFVCLVSLACGSSALRTATPAPTSTETAERRAVTPSTSPPLSTVPPLSTPTQTTKAEPASEKTSTPEPPNTPVQIEDLTGNNLLENGRLQDANGIPSFASWEQEPAYWCDWSANTRNCGLHGPLPQSPSQTWSLQADRDYKNADTWPAGCCPEARAWTETGNVPSHNHLYFGWEEIHHLNGSVFELRVFGILASGEMVEIFLQEGPRSPEIRTKQDPPGVYLVEIPVPEGGYPAYRIEVYVRLMNEFDGILIGDFKLIAQP